MRRLLALGCAGLGLAALFAVPTPAQGVSAGLDADTASLHMLRRADVTPATGLSGPFIRVVEDIVRPAAMLCNQANQNLVTAPRAMSGVAVALGQADGSGVEQDVFEYGSTAAAAQAFSRLQRRAAACDQINAAAALGKAYVQRLTNGQAPVQFDGVPGVWTREVTGRAGADLGRSGYESYSVNLLVGSAIQQVTLSMLGADRTTDVQRSATDTLAVRLAQRWVAAGSH